jgi:hypothetical protein
MNEASKTQVPNEPEFKEDDFFSERPFEKAFHNAAARIVDFLILFRDFDYSESELCRKTRLSYKTVRKELDNLVKQDVVKITRTIGRSEMYRISDSKHAQLLVQYADTIADPRYNKLSTDS